MSLPTIGELRERISIQTVTQVPGAGALLNRSFVTNATVWGKVEPLTDLQRLAYVNRGTGATHRMTIRGRADVTADKWLFWSGRRYRIVGLRDPKENGAFLELVVEEDRTV